MGAIDLQFRNCRLELKLEPQSPMIHFQAKQTGATIRASEVKPKLDGYILAQLIKKENMTIDELKSSEDYKCIFQDGEASSDNHALKYKMQITCEEPPVQIIVNHGIKNYDRQFKIYYGNSGKDPEDKYFGIISKPKITFLCFQPKVCSLITEYIKSFFLTVNFGTMQGKGFGSFAPVGYGQVLTDREKVEIARYLKAKLNAKYCFAMSFDAQKCDEKQAEYWDKIFDEIRIFYGLMKSGQNAYNYSKAYIYQYMMNKGIKNEKAEIKQKGIAPILCKPENRKKYVTSDAEEKPRYVRAFLGTANQVTYGRRYKTEEEKNGRYVLDGKNKVTVTIENIQQDGKKKGTVKNDGSGKDELKIERFASPIFFKIIRNTVFIVAVKIPEEMYGAKFKFSSKLKNEPLYISTPSKEDMGNQEFDTSAFLKEYADYYNGLIENNKIKNIAKQRCRKVTEIK